MQQYMVFPYKYKKIWLFENFFQVVLFNKGHFAPLSQLLCQVLIMPQIPNATAIERKYSTHYRPLSAHTYDEFKFVILDSH